MTRWWQALVAGFALSGAALGQELMPPPSATVAASRAEVRTAINRATSRYPGDSACAEMLRMFHHELLDHEATVEEATAILAALADGRGFLAMPEFVELREKLHHYLALLRQTTEPDVADKYASHVAVLKAALQAVSLAEAEDAYRWLAQRELASELRHEAAAKFALNNVVLRVSASSGNRILPNPFTQNFHNITSMQGTPAAVTGTLVAHSHLYTPPAGQRQDHAGITVHAVVNTNVGMNRQRVSLGANGTTKLFAEVLLEVRDNDFHIAGTSLSSRTSMNLSYATANSRCRLVNRTVNGLAGRVFDRKRGEINAQADQQIVAEGRPAMITEVASIIGQINTGKNEIIAPIVAYGLVPRLGVSSDPDGLNMTFRVATDEQLTAQSLPAAPAVGTGSYLAVHESAANNAGAMFGGLTIDEQQFRETVFDSLGFTPLETASPRGGEVPHTLTFSHKAPLVSQFSSDQLKIRLTIDGLFNGVEKFTFEKPVTTDVIYRFDSQPQGVLLVREKLDCHMDEPQKAKFEATLSRFLVPMAKQDDLTTLGQLLSIVRLRADKPVAAEGWLQMPLVER